VQYVVETRFVGERRVEGAPAEIVGNESREVDGALRLLFGMCFPLQRVLPSPNL